MFYDGDPSNKPIATGQDYSPPTFAHIRAAIHAVDDALQTPGGPVTEVIASTASGTLRNAKFEVAANRIYSDDPAQPKSHVQGSLWINRKSLTVGFDTIGGNRAFVNNEPVEDSEEVRFIARTAFNLMLSDERSRPHVITSVNGVENSDPVNRGILRDCTRTLHELTEHDNA